MAGNGANFIGQQGVGQIAGQGLVGILVHVDFYSVKGFVQFYTGVLRILQFSGYISLDELGAPARIRSPQPW